VEAADSSKTLVAFYQAPWHATEWIDAIVMLYTSDSPKVARCAANIMKVYFKNEKKPICIEIFIRVDQPSDHHLLVK
jgi:hypothetical protein